MGSSGHKGMCSSSSKASPLSALCSLQAAALRRRRAGLHLLRVCGSSCAVLALVLQPTHQVCALPCSSSKPYESTLPTLRRRRAASFSASSSSSSACTPTGAGQGRRQGNGQSGLASYRQSSRRQAAWPPAQRKHLPLVCNRPLQSQTKPTCICARLCSSRRCALSLRCRQRGRQQGVVWLQAGGQPPAHVAGLSDVPMAGAGGQPAGIDERRWPQRCQPACPSCRTDTAPRLHPTAPQASPLQQHGQQNRCYTVAGTV